MTNRSATVLAFGSAICIAPIHLALSSMSMEPSIDDIGDAFVYFAATFLIFLPYTALSGLLVAGPIYFVSNKISLLTWWMAVIAGAIAGVCAAFSVFGQAAVPINFMTYLLLGALSGFVFWLVRSFAIRDR